MATSDKKTWIIIQQNDDGKYSFNSFEKIIDTEDGIRQHLADLSGDALIGPFMDYDDAMDAADIEGDDPLMVDAPIGTEYPENVSHEQDGGLSSFAVVYGEEIKWFAYEESKIPEHLKEQITVWENNIPFVTMLRDIVKNNVEEELEYETNKNTISSYSVVYDDTNGEEPYGNYDKFKKEHDKINKQLTIMQKEVMNVFTNERLFSLLNEIKTALDHNAGYHIDDEELRSIFDQPYMDEGTIIKEACNRAFVTAYNCVYLCDSSIKNMEDVWHNENEKVNKIERLKQFPPCVFDEMDKIENAENSSLSTKERDTIAIDSGEIAD